MAERDVLVVAPMAGAAEERQAEELLALVAREVAPDVEEADERAREDVARFMSKPMAMRYLRARKFNTNKARAMMARSVKWRIKEGVAGLSAGDMEAFSTEGKMWIANRTDAKGRNVLVMDNDKEKPNSVSRKDQMRFLAWNLERSVRRNRIRRRKLDPKDDESNEVEKHVVFIKLDQFKLSTSPSIGSTLDTIDVVCNHYPERLGLAVLYKPPRAFNALWSVAKRALDPTTQQKLLVLSDASPGSEGERELLERIGPDWREISGIGMPQPNPRVSSGYMHDDVWHAVRQEEGVWSELTGRGHVPAPAMSDDEYFSAEEDCCL